MPSGARRASARATQERSRGPAGRRRARRRCRPARVPAAARQRSRRGRASHENGQRRTVTATVRLPFASVRLRGASSRPRTLAYDAQRPAWSTMPPISSGRPCGRLDGPAGGSRSCRRSLAPRRRRARRRRQLDLSRPCSRATARRTRARSRRARRPAPSPMSREEVPDELVGVGEQVANAAAFAPGSSCGFSSSAPSSGTSSTRRRSRRALCTARGGPAPSPPRRARGRTCGARLPSSVSCLLQRGEVEVADRLVDQPAVVLVGEHAADDAARRRRASSSATSARICSSARAVSASICLRVSSSRRCRSASVSSSHALALRVGDLARLGEDLARPRPWPGRSAPGAPRAARGPRRARCPPPRAACADPLAPLVDVFWIGPNAYRLSTKNVIPNAISVQIIRPGTTSMRPVRGDERRSSAQTRT